MSRDFYDMMHGVFKGSEYLLKCIEYGKDVNAKDDRGKSVLMYACQFGDLRTTKILIDNGANVNMKDNLGKTAFMYVCTFYGCSYARNYILENMIIIREYSRVSTVREYLSRSIELERVLMLQYLLQQGARINDTDKFKKTALMYASEYGSADAVCWLLNEGASFNLQDDRGKTALIHACSHFSKKDVAPVKYLVEKGAKVNETDYLGVTPLMCASKFESISIIEYLISMGANVEQKNSRGKNALMYACKYSNIKAMKVLIEHDADVNSKDNRDKTVLMHMVDTFYENKLDAIKCVIKYGSRLNDRDIEGKTALVYACDYRQIEVVQYLLDKGADINVRDVNGRSLLRHAFVSIHPRIMKLLIENNIRMNLSEEPIELRKVLNQKTEEELDYAFRRMAINQYIPKLVLRIYYETRGIERLLARVYQRVDDMWHTSVSSVVDNRYKGKFSDENLLRDIDVITKFSIKNSILERTMWILKKEIKKIKKICTGKDASDEGETKRADVTEDMIRERIEPNKKMLLVLKKEQEKLLDYNANVVKDMLICAKNLQI